MKRMLLSVPLLVLAMGALPAEEETRPEQASGAAEAQAEKEKADKGKPKQEDPKALSGMSILGNQEAPKSLVIVPWKSSELGNSLGIAPMLDDSRKPIDRDVFLRALSYYEIRSGRK
jgi:hypothetical protein